MAPPFSLCVKPKFALGALECLFPLAVRTDMFLPSALPAVGMGALGDGTLIKRKRLLNSKPSNCHDGVILYNYNCN